MVTDHKPPRWYRLGEVADMLSYDRKTIVGMINHGELRGYKHKRGAHWRINADDVDYLNEHPCNSGVLSAMGKPRRPRP